MATLARESFLKQLKEYLSNTAIIKMFKDINEGIGNIFGNKDIEQTVGTVDEEVSKLTSSDASKIAEALRFQGESLDERAKTLDIIQKTGDLPNKLKEQNIEGVHIEESKTEPEAIDKAKDGFEREERIK